MKLVRFLTRRPFGLPNWAKKSQGVDMSGRSGAVVGGGLLRANSGFSQQQPQQQRDSQGSVESQGGSSSGVSEFESKSIQATSSAGEAKSSGSIPSLEEKGNQEAAELRSTKKSCRTSGIGSTENSSKRPDSRYKGKEVRGNRMSDMPCVFPVSSCIWLD